MKKGVAPAFTITQPGVSGGGVGLPNQPGGIQQMTTVSQSQNFNSMGIFKHTEQQQQEDAPNESVNAQVLQMAMAADQQNQKVDENFVKRKIDSMCGCPKKEKIQFYRKDDDENECTLGRFLFKISHLYTANCDYCKEAMKNHFIQYYHKEGCVEIQLQITNQQTLANVAKKLDNKRKDILMHGECSLCRKQVTDDILISNTLYEYSKARFLEQFFYNDKLLNSSHGCEHRSMKDIQWYFFMPGGFQITFTYIPQEVYSIEMIQPKKNDTTEIYKREVQMRKEKIADFAQDTFLDLKSRIKKLTDFIKAQKAKIPEYKTFMKSIKQKMIEDQQSIHPNHQDVAFLWAQLRNIKKLISPNTSKDNQEHFFENDIALLWKDSELSAKEVKNIFEALFLERKILLSFMTYLKVLEEASKIVCLLLALLKMRMSVIMKNEKQFVVGQQETTQLNTSIDASERAGYTDLDSFHPDTHKQAASSSQNNTSFQSARKNSHNLESQNLNETFTSIDQQLNKELNLLELFGINSQEASKNMQQQQLNMTQANILLSGKVGGQMPPAGAGAGQAGGMPQMIGNIQNIEYVKNMINRTYQQMYSEMQKSVCDPQTSSNVGQNSVQQLLNISKILEEEEEKQRNPALDTSMTKHQGLNREGSNQHLLQQQQKTASSNPQQQPTKTPDIMGSNDIADQPITGSPCPKWLEALKIGFTTMPLGTDNVHIPLQESNIGSIISFALASNIYKEAMIKQNYMDIYSKIKAPAKYPRQQQQVSVLPNFGSNNNNESTIPLGSLRESLVGMPNQSSLNNPLATPSLISAPSTMTNMTTTTNNNINSQDESIKLYGKDDVFNFELSPHQIEAELLCGERMYFFFKFATEKRDLSLKVIKSNNQELRLQGTSMLFQTGFYETIETKKQGSAASLLTAQSKQSDNQAMGGSGGQQQQSMKKEVLRRNDLQEKVASKYPKEYLDLSGSKALTDLTKFLDSLIQILNACYLQGKKPDFDQGSSPLKNAPTNMTDDMHNPHFEMIAENMQPANSAPNTGTLHFTNQFTNTLTDAGAATALHQNVGTTRDSLVTGGTQTQQLPHLNQLKSPEMMESTSKNITLNIPQTTPQLMSNQLGSPNLGGNQLVSLHEFCKVQSPALSLSDPFTILKNELSIPKVEYEVKAYFPKKFEALRRFYCGSHYDFLQSLISTQEWLSVSGGKTKSKFYRSFDDKYVIKEIKKNEFKMFLEFAPQYFDYLCKSFFHNYPTALCKILGAFKINIITYKNNYKDNNTKQQTKKYIYITENLNYGLKKEDEPHLIRYDLKGSTLNRFVKKQQTESKKLVLHDNNFLLHFQGRPLPIRYTINRILHICINNDTLCLSKSNIVDYSLLTIIDTKRKKVRFGIIDYVQQYTLEKVFEGNFKRIINRGEVPTIVDPDKYKYRFKRAMKRYFIGMIVQDEKVIQVETGAGGKKLPVEGGGGHNQTVIIEEPNSDEEDDTPLNKTHTNIKVMNDAAHSVAPGGNSDSLKKESENNVLSPPIQ